MYFPGSKRILLFCYSNIPKSKKTPLGVEKSAPPKENPPRVDIHKSKPILSELKNPQLQHKSGGV